MNEQAEEALARMIDLAIDGIEGAKSFAEAELPSVVEQLLIWKMLESLIPVFFTLVLWGIAAYLLIGTPAALRRAKKAYENGEKWTLMYQQGTTTSILYDIASLGLHRIIPGFLAILIGLITLNFTWLQILVAPKIYLLEYASDLVK